MIPTGLILCGVPTKNFPGVVKLSGLLRAPLFSDGQFIPFGCNTSRFFQIFRSCGEKLMVKVLQMVVVVSDWLQLGSN